MLPKFMVYFVEKTIQGIKYLYLHKKIYNKQGPQIFLSKHVCYVGRSDKFTAEQLAQILYEANIKEKRRKNDNQNRRTKRQTKSRRDGSKDNMGSIVSA